MAAVLLALSAGCGADRLERVLAERATHLSEDERGRLAAAVRSAARESGLDELLLLAVVEQESTYRAAARGPRGALGLMQIRPATAADVARRHDLPYAGPDDLHRPEVNLRLGARYLAELIAAFDDRAWGLTAYNRGPTATRRLRRRDGARPSVYARHVERRWVEMRE